MRDVVIIGGGLTGLAAAYELHRLNIACTLIEVKPRLGGSIESESRDGFVIDYGVMLTQDTLHAPFLEEIGLANEVFRAREDEDGTYIAFTRGMGVLIDRLSEPLLDTKGKHSLMMRMAVSSLGRMDSRRFSICMENGMVLDAKAIIVTAPARYAERIFHTLKPEISFQLLDYRYDNIARLSLGYQRIDALPMPDEPPADYPISYIHHVNHPERVPEGHVLVQAGIRYEPDKGLSPDIVGEFAALMGWNLNPVIERVTMWKEADPLMWVDDDHPQRMKLIQHLLPEGIALAGSDYIPKTERPTLQDRIEAGQAAAHKVIEWLKSR
jgi:protoporphyrinogen oxidase